MKDRVLLVLVVTLAVVPLVLHRPAPGTEREGAAAFEGTDAQASALIEKLRPGYQPWVAPLFEPPSREIESLLFALQAALGAGVLFYHLGYVRGRARAQIAAASAPGKAAAANGPPAF